MKNRTGIIAIIALFLCISIYSSMIGFNGGENSMKAQVHGIDMGETLQRAGCTWIKTHVNSWTLVEDLYLSIEELEDIGLEIGRLLELEDDYELLRNHQNNIKQIAIKGLDERKINYDIIITNTRDNNKGVNNTYETHIIVNTLMDNSLMCNKPVNPQEIQNKIESSFKGLQRTPQTSTTYTGEFKGELTKKQKKRIVDNVIGEIKGKPSQTMENYDIVSVAGYSPIIHTEPIENINFHIALRYSEYSDSTYLWMGSPIITIEY